MAFLGQGPVTPSTMDDRTEVIREFILDELGEFGEKHFPNIGRRVRYAQDVVSLWYTRGDVMAVLSAVHGETIAREKVDRITDTRFFRMNFGFRPIFSYLKNIRLTAIFILVIRMDAQFYY